MFKGFGLALKGLRLAFIAVKFFINNKGKIVKKYIGPLNNLKFKEILEIIK